MFALLHSVTMFVIDFFKSPRRLEAENLFLRHQLSIALRHAPPRLQLRGSDRALLVWMTRRWPSLLGAAQVVQPESEEKREPVSDEDFHHQCGVIGEDHAGLQHAQKPDLSFSLAESTGGVDGHVSVEALANNAVVKGFRSTRRAWRRHCSGHETLYGSARY
jgi:hypothetical protein